MICEIWIRSFAYFRHFTLSIRRIWPALYIFARTFLVSSEIKFGKRRILLQEDEFRPVRKPTFDAPFHRSSHKWWRAAIRRASDALCGEGRGPNPVFAFRGEPMIYIVDSSSSSTDSPVRAFAPFDTPSCCRWTVWSSLFLFRISMFRVKDSRTEQRLFTPPFRATKLVVSRIQRVTMSRKIEKKRKSRFEKSNDL